MKNEKLSIRAFAFAGALTWGGAVLLVGLCNMAWPGYGEAFLRMISSVYPGYHAHPTIGSVAVGTGYALLDGAVGAAFFAWLYNR